LQGIWGDGHRIRLRWCGATPAAAGEIVFKRGQQIEMGRGITTTVAGEEQNRAARCEVSVQRLSSGTECA